MNAKKRSKFFLTNGPICLEAKLLGSSPSGLNCQAALAQVPLTSKRWQMKRKCKWTICWTWK